LRRPCFLRNPSLHRFRRTLDRGNVTEALSAASELQHVGLSEALELCLLLVEKEPERFQRQRFAGMGATAASTATSTSMKGKLSSQLLVRSPASGGATRPSRWPSCSVGVDSSAPARYLSAGRGAGVKEAGAPRVLRLRLT